MATLLHIGEQLRQARIERGLYKKALAEKCGINRNTLHNLESGVGNVELNTLLAVCDELGLDLFLGPKQVAQKMGMRNPNTVPTPSSFINRAISDRKKSMHGRPEGDSGDESMQDEPRRIPKDGDL